MLANDGASSDDTFFGNDEPIRASIDMGSNAR